MSLPQFLGLGFRRSQRWKVTDDLGLGCVDETEGVDPLSLGDVDVLPNNPSDVIVGQPDPFDPCGPATAPFCPSEFHHAGI